LDTGKTPEWAGATPLLGAFGCPKESWGRSSPANRKVLCLRSVLPVVNSALKMLLWKDKHFMNWRKQQQQAARKEVSITGAQKSQARA
jgi:hypothetical protein